MRTSGEILRHLRGDLSKEEVARRGSHVSGIVGAALVHWEANRRVPSPLQLWTLLSLYEATVEDTLALLEACATAPGTLGGLYRSLLACWLPGMDATAKHASFTQWATAQAQRARRGAR